MVDKSLQELWPDVLLAAVSVAGLSHDLIAAVQEDDVVDFDNAMGLLCDAIIALGKVEVDDERDGQLIAAAHKWIGENR